MLRRLLKSVDAELSRMPYGHTLGLYCELQGRQGNRLLDSSQVDGAKSLRSSGYVQCNSELPREAITAMASILDKLEMQRDTGCNQPELEWTRPYLVSKPETVRLNLPANGLPAVLEQSVAALSAKLPSLIGIEAERLGVTLYRNRTTADTRLISADWHFDRRPTDWLRFFVYLSDVDPHCGPFKFIDLQNSKRLTRMGFKRESAAWQSRLQSEPSLHVLTGQAGAGLVINVERLLHRAGIPEPGKHRDMLELIFKPRAA